jgi:predicted Rossmann fold nucleotide-binding protein DprA/Smf involved in DNA uptake
MTETRFDTQGSTIERAKTFLRMRLVSGLSLRACHVLLAHFKDPQAIVSARPHDFDHLSVSSGVVNDLLSNHSADEAEKEWAKATRRQVRVVDLLSPDYPPLLREIFDPPMVLYIRGSRWSANEPRWLSWGHAGQLRTESTALIDWRRITQTVGSQ